MPDDLAALRAEMDALNLRLRDLLQQRALLVRRIGRVKRALGSTLADPEREQAMLAAVLAEPDEGFDRAALTAIFAVVFRESRALLLRGG